MAHRLLSCAACPNGPAAAGVGQSGAGQGCRYHPAPVVLECRRCTVLYAMIHDRRPYESPPQVRAAWDMAAAQGLQRTTAHHTFHPLLTGPLRDRGEDRSAAAGGWFAAWWTPSGVTVTYRPDKTMDKRNTSLIWAWSRACTILEYI